MVEFHKYISEQVLFFSSNKIKLAAPRRFWEA